MSKITDIATNGAFQDGIFDQHHNLLVTVHIKIWSQLQSNAFDALKVLRTKYENPGHFMWEEEDGKAVDLERDSTDDLLLHPGTRGSSNDPFSPHIDAASEVNHLNAPTMSISSNSLILPSPSRNSFSSIPKKFPPLLPPPGGLSSPPAIASPITLTQTLRPTVASLMALRPKRGRPLGRPPTMEILHGRRKVNFVQMELACMLHLDAIFVIMVTYY